MRGVMLAAIMVLTSAAISAQDLPAAYSTGPVIEDFGPVANVPGAEALPPESEFRVAFDTASAAEDGGLNRTLVSAARFINMHARAGIDPANLHVAVVIHGSAVSDVAHAEVGEDNPNAPLIAALVDQNVEIHVCGQSAVYYGVSHEDLLPGVVMSLSAMTAHAQLQQRGYTLNPF